MSEKKKAEKLAKARDTSLSGLVRDLILEETNRVRGLKTQGKTNGKSNGAKAKASGTKARAKPKAAPKKTARRKPAPTQL